MDYDATLGRVIIKSWVDSRWLASANLETAKKELTEQATNYCVDGLLMAIAGLPNGAVYVAMSQPPKDYCQVDFFTWGSNGKGQLEAKDVAVFEGGQVRLK